MASQEAMFIDEEDAEKLIGETDFNKLRDFHFTAGVREGVTAGKESAVQDGFDSGYKQAFLKFRNIGKLRGVLSGLLTHIKSRDEYRKPRHESQEYIEALLLKLTNVELEEIKETKCCLKDVEIVLEPQANVTKCGLSELWNECRNICYEFDIDIEKILATLE